MSPISVLKQDDHTDLEIGDDESKDLGVSTSLSDIEENDLDHQQEVLLLAESY